MEELVEKGVVPKTASKGGVRQLLPFGQRREERSREKSSGRAQEQEEASRLGHKSSRRSGSPIGALPLVSLIPRAR